MSGFRVLVCGGRDFGDYGIVARTLDELKRTRGALHVIQGGAHGADALARDWCHRQPYTHLTNVPADWRSYGKAAGAIRNQRMLDEYDPELVVAFPGGRGTADMVRRAEKAGVPVMKVEASP